MSDYKKTVHGLLGMLHSPDLLAQQQMQSGILGTLGGGKPPPPPKLVPAAKVGGKTVIGKLGQIHPDLVADKDYSKAIMGFADEAGNFFTREQAALLMGGARSINPRNQKPELHSFDITPPGINRSIDLALGRAK
jgi:hypothetical protein